MDIPTDSAERIAFLEQQLAGAVMFLRQKDATEEACARRIEGIYKAAFADMRTVLDRQRKQMIELSKVANRYRFLRQYMVQVWRIGIAASDEQLDKALDEQIQRAQEKTT